MTYKEIDASILHSMEALGTKPEDYAEMIQRCLDKKAQQRMENGVFKDLEAGCQRTWECGGRPKSLTT